MADKPNTEKKITAKKAKVSDHPPDKSASLSGATSEAPLHGPSTKKGKLLAKHKHRLPRRQKKAQKKGAARL